MSFKFVLDENITVIDECLPQNVINARELFFQNGVRQFGIEDKQFLRLARKHGYIIITKDSGLVIRANQSYQDVVYADGPHYGKKWYLIPKTERISNRLRLKKFLMKEGKEYNQHIMEAFVMNAFQKKTNSLIPYYATNKDEV